MAALYVVVLVATSGVSHLSEQWGRYGILLFVLWVLFGAQVALLIDLRRGRTSRLAATDAAAAGSTAVGMLACCAHHVAEIVPVLASVGLASALVAWQPWILGLALVLSLVGTTATWRRWTALPRSGDGDVLPAVTVQGQSCAH
jgi:hypothetical protein